MSKYGVISGLYFPVFGLDMEIYGVNLHIQSEYRKIRSINNLYLATFHAVFVKLNDLLQAIKCPLDHVM